MLVYTHPLCFASPKYGKDARVKSCSSAAAAAVTSRATVRERDSSIEEDDATFENSTHESYVGVDVKAGAMSTSIDRAENRIHTFELRLLFADMGAGQMWQNSPKESDQLGRTGLACSPFQGQTG